MTEVQPMKMAAAEALWDSKSDASFSLFTIGTRDATREVFSVRVPYLLSYLADGDIHAKVEGINDLQAEYAQRFGPGDYTPHVPITYWSFRYMIGLGGVTTGVGASRYLAHSTRQASGQSLVLARVHLDHTAGDPGEQLRLDLHRDGPSAVGGVRPNADARSTIAVRSRVAGDHLPRSCSQSCTSSSPPSRVRLIFRYAQGWTAA